MADGRLDGTSKSRQSALAEINFNSLAASEYTASSEDESPNASVITSDDALSLVGVSLGQAQTRLTSPKTPAFEKAAAIEAAGGLFAQTDGSLEEPLEDVGGDEDETDAFARVAHGSTDSQDILHPDQGLRHTLSASTQQRFPRLPSPLRAGRKGPPREEHDKSIIRNGMFSSGRRASSGQEPESTFEHWQKSLRSNLPSFPRHFSLTSPFSANHEYRSGSVSHAELPRPSSHSSTSLNRPVRHRSASGGEGAPGRDNITSPPPSEGAQYARQKTESLRLRRSTSDTSMHLKRVLSTASSLGDDSRFEDVQEMVNSRVKAIKDSFQDSNIKLPSLPSFASLSSLSLSSFKSDLAHLSGQLPRRSSSVKKPNTANASAASDLPHTYSRDPTQHTTLSGDPAADGPSNKAATAYPHFSKACASLSGDLVVLGGYRGSILRSAEPPHRQLWVPVKVGLNIRKVDLEVGLDQDAGERMEEKIFSSGMLTHIGPVDISRRLFKRLRATENVQTGKLRVHDYGYDWRLDPTLLSKKLITFLETLECNRPGTPRGSRGAIVIAHSLGGLITRHAVNERPELFSGVIFAGTPATCVNILGPLRNGDDVLLSSRVLTAQVNFTIRTSYAFLPLDGKCFFNKETKEQYPVDFFDAKTWGEYRLSPCIARPLPPLDPAPPGMISGLMNSMSGLLPNLPGKRSSVAAPVTETASHHGASAIGGLAGPSTMGSTGHTGDDAVAQGNIDRRGTDNDTNAPGERTGVSQPASKDADQDTSTSIATTVTIPRDQATAYLTRTLASVKRFKQDLAFRPAHAEANIYPPFAVIYGKSTPTVYGAKVASREAIKHACAFDELAFASGDGVVLARAAMLPSGYSTARGGIVSSSRGHITLLGDLEAVGRALNAVISGRGKGVGLGLAA